MRPGSSFAIVVLIGVSFVASSASARKGTLSDEEQMRALLAQLAAASAEAPPQQRTDADLMYDAMKQWRGEPRGSDAVDKALAQSKKEIGRDRKSMEIKIRSMFFRDPFAEESQRFVPVRKTDRDLLADYSSRHGESRGDSGDSEVSRLRASLSEARADAISARAETSRLRAELERTQEELRLSGSGEASEAQNGRASGIARHARRQVNGRSHAGQSADRIEALNSPTPSRVHRHAPAAVAKPQETAASPAPPVEMPVETPVVVLPPEGSTSSDPRGIIVVPIETPVQIHAAKPRGRHPTRRANTEGQSIE